MVRYVTIPRFAELSGYSPAAIRTKIRDGIWRDGREWRRAPDGRILVDVDGYHAWVEGGRALQVRHKAPPGGASPAPLR